MNPSFSHIKMVAIDCDETLVRSDNTVSDYTVDVLHRLQQRGIVVTIATGRMYQTAKPIGQALKLGHVPMILFSGGFIQELETGCKLFEQTVSVEAVQRIYELAKQYDSQVLANLPIEPAIREGGDSGKPVTYFAPESVSAKRYMIAAERLISFLDAQDEVSNAAIQPIMPAGVSACSTEGQKIKAEHEAAQKKSSGGCGTGCGCH